MRTKLLLFIAIAVFFSCTKETINVSLIHQTDAQGNPIGGAQPDNQWKAQNFTTAEMNLFQPLDTADLSGTTMPIVQTVISLIQIRLSIISVFIQQ